MRSDAARTESFSKFVVEAEPRIRRAMTAALGVQAGRDATTDALMVAWKNWDRVAAMDNPVGYLYRVAVNEARRPKVSDIAQDLSAATAGIPWIEPGLIAAVVELPERQRTIVSLIHAFDWSLGEVAELLGISKSTVRTHEQRALRTLRKRLGVRV